MSRLLILAPVTLFECSPPELVRAAAGAGFGGVGMRLNPIRAGEIQQPMLGDTPMMRETEALLRDTGLTVFDMEAMWLRSDTDIETYKPFMAAGARLGVRQILTGVDPMENARMIDLFGRVCDQAAGFGLGISLEVMPWTGVNTVKRALEILGEVSRPNARLLLDSLHLDRSGGSPADIAGVPTELLAYAQVCDAKQERPDTLEGLRIEAISDRRLPGEGVLPLRDFVKALPADLPISIEVPLQMLGDLSPAEKAVRAMQAMKSVL